jgi:hypothetical protein
LALRGDSPQRGRSRPNSARVLFRTHRFDADDWSGPAFKVCKNATAPFRGRKGLHDDLLHYTSIENRCENLRLVRRQLRSMVDRARSGSNTVDRGKDARQCELGVDPLAKSRYPRL